MAFPAVDDSLVTTIIEKTTISLGYFRTQFLREFTSTLSIKFLQTDINDIGFVPERVLKKPTTLIKN